MGDSGDSISRRRIWGREHELDGRVVRYDAELVVGSGILVDSSTIVQKYMYNMHMLEIACRFCFKLHVNHDCSTHD